MKFSRPVITTTFLTCLLILVGCGGSDENTVITPGEDYQLNEQEQENLEMEKKMRQEGGN